ncbi:MAG: 1-phosphofructokinase family hexose kinase [Planctomycetota bacterium]|jgi:1-phosphofructokinase family hexose kinase
MIYCIGLNPAIDKTVKADDFSIGSHQKVKILQLQAAGKAANAARILASLGIDVSLHGFLGAGDVGFYKESFNGLPVNLKFTPVSYPTRVNTTIIDEKNKSETHLREEGFTVSENNYIAFEKKLLGNIKPGDTAVFCGSIPVGLNLLLFKETLQSLIDKNVKTGGDFNGDVLEIIKSLRLSFIKPNREEFSQLIGENIESHESLLEKAANYQKYNVSAENLILSDGEYGAGIVNTQNFFWVKPLPVEPLNTVGAGDALLAGYIAKSVNTTNMEEILKFAVSSSLSSISKYSAGIVDSSEISDFYSTLSAIKMN